MYWPVVGLVALVFVLAGVFSGFIFFVLDKVENVILALVIIFGTLFVLLSILLGFTVGPSDLQF